jgi:hypothetical protein
MLLRSCGLQTTRDSSISRGIIPPSFANLPVTQSEGAERRQAPGCSGTRCCRRAPHEARARPRADSSRRPRSRGTLASRRSTAAVFWPRARLRDTFGRCLTRRCPPDSRAAFAGPARSGGWAVLPGRLPGVVVTSQPAGRRIPLRLTARLRKTPSVSGTRLT